MAMSIFQVFVTHVCDFISLSVLNEVVLSTAASHVIFIGDGPVVGLALCMCRLYTNPKVCVTAFTHIYRCVSFSCECVCVWKCKHVYTSV